MSELLKIGGLWRNQNPQTGKVSLSGNLNQSVRIVILPNGFKTEAKHPDYIMYIAPNEQPATELEPVAPAPVAPAPAPTRQQTRQPSRRPAPVPPSNDDMDDFNDPFAE